ncbi:MAG: hypothetical protein V4631_03235 [Pseudomonadota bacterium]
MSEKSFAFASVSVAIVLGVFFYPPPAPPKPAPPHVGQTQQTGPALLQTRGRPAEIGVD